jgi:hypothetical protein
MRELWRIYLSFNCATVSLSPMGPLQGRTEQSLLQLGEELRDPGELRARIGAYPARPRKDLAAEVRFSIL